MNTNVTVVIDNPRLLGTVCGPNDRNLAEISALLKHPVRTRGNRIQIDAPDGAVKRMFQDLMNQLRNLADGQDSISRQQVRSVYGFVESANSNESDRLRPFQKNLITIPGSPAKIYPRSRRQAAYIEQITAGDLVFSAGPAGTGKTFLAVAYALRELLSRKKRKIVLTRPVIESGENLGFLPGDLSQKLSPYLRPLYDAMEELLEPEKIERLKEGGQIEIAPLAYMRGRSLKNCVIILDEAQNTGIDQMKMFLTRLGEGSKAIVTGDLTQIDLPSASLSGLAHAIQVLSDIKEISVIRFDSADVVRHPLVKKIVDAYQNHA